MNVRFGTTLQTAAFAVLVCCLLAGCNGADPAAPRHTLTLTQTGSGTCESSPQPGNDGRYSDGTVVTISCDPIPMNWGSPDGSTSESDGDGTMAAGGPGYAIFYVVMTRDKWVAVDFLESSARYSLTFTKNGTGVCTVSPAPGGDGLYSAGTAVTISCDPIPANWGSPDGSTSATDGDGTAAAGGSGYAIFYVYMTRNKWVAVDFF
jgi:hypothetical protein